MQMNKFTVNFITFLLLTLSSCSTLVGNVKPVDEKSKGYQIIEPSSAAWTKLDPTSLVSDKAKFDPKSSAYSSEVTDISFQSKKTAAIISLNSSCREGRAEEKNLDLIARELLLGITDITLRTDQTLSIDNTPALQTTVQGKIAGSLTKIRTVVISKSGCIFDLMYVSSPERFKAHEEDFNRFVSSLRLR
jgi:hypothetical protein